MSTSGIQSNRGDGYQTLVAFGLALTVLSDPDHEWLEIDSVTCLVDDVVVGKADGTKICCQCKKNQKNFKSWAVTDLADELKKASKLLVTDPKAVVRFYSRSPFGELAALAEYSASFFDESAYQANLGAAHRATDEKLNDLLAEQTGGLSAYEFLRRITFVTSEDLSRMQALLRERLSHLATNPSAAYDALWSRLDHLGMRLEGDVHSKAAQHRLTKEDLRAVLAEAGSMLSPPLDIAKARASFKSTSAIGRAWRRDIGNERIPSPAVGELLQAIDKRARSVLLTGLPGSGKTCAMLDLQEELERRAQTRIDLMPLFVQSREFADMATAQDRQAQGLSEHWVEEAARMAEDAHVVVVIDSLDVLSIAREHSILTYFLAQIDRLLLVRNVTVVTACRDFDRHYDRRIALREWDAEIKCRPLDWNNEIAPLLAKHDIDASITDKSTRELICNPRELALFVELAKRDGSFNVVTSQALAKRYLVSIVQGNSSLGDIAMRAIESIAAEMLDLRSLSIPSERFAAPQGIRRALLSHNVLHETTDGKLAFGHQTLLDVLVVSGAMRAGMTLSDFIRGLPSVPFVRPSIRSFIAQLAIGDRKELRGQLRTVLSGSSAFHIRRLVAETYAEHLPQDEDWPLIRDLRNHHRDVFQVIYQQAVKAEWHSFWLRNLVPVLKDSRDAEGLTMHVHRVALWKNDDAAGVLTFWTEVLGLAWVDKVQIAWQLEAALSGVDQKHSALLAPVLLALLDLPRQEHGSLGRALARSVQAGGLDDAALWRYVVGAINEEDIHAYQFGKKLRCMPHDFGSSTSTFFPDRMQQSVDLLELAVASIEHWGAVRKMHFGVSLNSYSSGYLLHTSHNDVHSDTGNRYLTSERILFDAVEAAVVHHATSRSEWWQSNRERLCFSMEGSLRYFAILSCSAAVASNLDVIARMLTDRVFLESDLSHEVGALMHCAFLQLDCAAQDTVQTTVLALHQEKLDDSTVRASVLHAQAQLILTIPCHLRFPSARAILNECEKDVWPLVRQAHIGMRGGMVRAPFPFEIFLAASDIGVLRLLAHYSGYSRDSFRDFLIGGEREVGSQLREAASREPTRFLRFLPAYWSLIADRFCDDIMEGVSAYLAHRYGNLQTNAGWAPIEEPDAAALAHQVLDELERHPSHWGGNRAASSALQGCAPVLRDQHEIRRLVRLAIGFSILREESSISGDSVDLITTGINMAKGHVVEAVMIMANELEKEAIAWPELLAPTLCRFAADDHPAIRALLLRRLPFLQSSQPELGWTLFDLAMQGDPTGLWTHAEPCLYYNYHQRFDVVAPRLECIYRDGSGKDLKTWGRISALAAFSMKVDFSVFLAHLTSREDVDGWSGAASVWTHPENVQQHREQCLTGLEFGLDQKRECASAVARKFANLFRDTSPPVCLPAALIERYFAVLETDEEVARGGVYGFDAWLNATSIIDPLNALAATEGYLNFVRRTKTSLYDLNNDLTQLMTRLFAQAEEQEESDDGAMLQRVVVVQDALLALGVNGMNEWLKAAERT
ncbi:AAA family ATPase [Variovorax paradoxus]|uniref:AAA family ATPase n=1 Tax=Variovorax paradoxus TaxID=34073 RepID=UPI002480DB85|nr:ATP-binding protein [Variovorax paradoxus]WGT63677.1 ATP-binding protein [Variovorax paradoxus]